MIIAETIDQVRSAVAQARSEAKTIGLVPTMGALHEGHLSLIRCSRRQCDFTVVSIFVNPTQFGPAEDLAGYPRPFQADQQACQELRVDVIFAPSPEQMYPRQNLTWVNVEKLTEHLCGASRPGHFQGVCTVVMKLFNIVGPDQAFFGQKDGQQLAVLRRMVDDLNMPVRVVTCPTVRESDGLALSSRNQYLDPDQRQQALCLSRALARAAQMVTEGVTDPQTVAQAIRAVIDEQEDTQIDYISIVDSELLHPVEVIDAPVMIALAVRVGPARLIDNIVVDPPVK